MLWLLIGFVLYVLAFYPALLGFWARLRESPVSKNFVPRRVSILLAVRNGEKYLPAKLDNLLALDYPRELLEIFVIDDGSTDATAAIGRAYAVRDARIHVLSGPSEGKWSALNRGLTAAGGEILLFTDVRQPFAPGALRELIANFADPRVGCVSGELFIRDSTTGKAISGLYWRYEKFLRRQQSRIDSVIGATGAIYAQRKDLCQPLPPDTILDDVHFPMQAFFAGYRVVFEPAAQAWDEAAALSHEFSRKVRTLAGNYQLLGAFPPLLTTRNRMLFHFLSHKFARLFLPFALIGIAALSLAQHVWWLVAAQGVILLLALRPGAARSFVVLMLATLQAVSYLWRGPKGFWK
jgi:cellulose synthase/poly-beta-1,6-N-acetylglucosamine synthase-like glycosyltransferase